MRLVDISCSGLPCLFLMSKEAFPARKEKQKFRLLWFASSRYQKRKENFF